MTRHIGIDLGTANTLACVKGKGVVLREPTVVAYNTRTDKVLAVGTEAKEMIGKTPGSILAFRPLKDGVIAEFEVTKTMLKMFTKKLFAGSLFFMRPSMIVCIPYGVTEVERMAVEDAALEAGARSVALIEEPVAAAIGSGIDVANARGSMIVDIGGGTTEVAVLSLGGIVESKSLRSAGDKMDDAITAYIRKKYGLMIGETTAENIKKNIGSVHPLIDRGTMEVRGRSLNNGLPSTITVSSSDVEEALCDIIDDIVEAVKNTLEDTPPELAGDIYEDGIVLAGGGALLGGLDKLITDATGVPVRVAPVPLDGVILGIEKVLENIDEYKDTLNFVKYK